MKKLNVIMAVLFLITAGAYAGTELYRREHTDDTLPVITCPETTLVIQVGENDPEKLLEGVTAWDEKDGDLTARLMVEGIEKSIRESNETTLTYAVADSDGHVTKAQRTVRYSDYTPPRFALTRELRYEVGEPVVILDRVTASDVIDGDLSSQIKTTSLGLNATVEGRYPITFEVTNSMGDTSTWTAEIRISNRQAGEPAILLSQYLVYVERGAAFRPLDFVQQVVGGELEEVSVSSGVDTGTPGTYQVSYTCTGSTGVVGTTVLFVVVL